MSKYFTLTLCLFCFSCAENDSNTGDNNTSPDTVTDVAFVYDGYHNGQELHLLSNDSFTYERFVHSCNLGGERHIVSGTYKKDSNSLVLMPATIDLFVIPRDIKSGLKQTTTDYGPDSMKIKTAYTIVNWNNTQYLLSDEFKLDWDVENVNDFMRFADYYNSDLEPKAHGMYLINEKANKDTMTTDLDLAQIPGEWRKYFLTEPISAKIVDIQKTTDKEDDEITYWLIKLDKGLNDSVYTGMSFKTASEDIILYIDSVYENGCSGMVSLHEMEEAHHTVGTVLQTKWE